MPFLKSLSQKLLLIFTSLSVAIIVSITVTELNQTHATLTKNIVDHLGSIAQDRVKYLELLWNLRVEQVNSITSEKLIQSDVINYEKGTLDKSQLGQLVDFLNYELNILKKADPNGVGFYDLDILDNKGKIVYDLDNSSANVEKTLKISKAEKLPSKSFYSITYVPGRKIVTVQVVSPIFDSNDSTIGVVVARRDANMAYDALTDRSNMGQTGETYLVGSNKLMLSPSRFIPDAALHEKVDTLPVKECFEGGRNITGTIYPDYRGIPVFGISICKRDLGYVFLSEIDEKELFQPLTDLQNNIVLEGSISILMTILVIWFVSKKITRPIMILDDAAKRISGGDLETTIKIKTGDEFERFAKTFNEMAQTVKRQIEELQSLDKRKDEFLSMISHELKTPLFSIKFRAELLRDPTLYGVLHEKQLEAVEEIHKNSVRLEGLVEDILTVQSIATGKTIFHIEYIQLDQLMEQVVQHNLPLMKKKQIEFVNSTKESMTFKSDNERLTQVFDNLIANAVDFVTEKTGRIEINAKSKDGNILFYVKDNGIGMLKDKQQNVFKKFYQVDTTYTRKHGGIGLGLFICKGIVEGLGGKIWVESEEGRGSTFYFTIPK